MENLMKAHPKSQSTPLKEWVSSSLDKRNKSSECLWPSKISLFSEQSVYFITWSLWGPQYHAATMEGTAGYPKALLGVGKVLIQEKLLTYLADCQLPTAISSFIVWSTEVLAVTSSSIVTASWWLYPVLISRMKCVPESCYRNWGEGMPRHFFSGSMHAFTEVVNKRLSGFLLNKSVHFTNISCAVHVLGKQLWTKEVKIFPDDDWNTD